MTQLMIDVESAEELNRVFGNLDANVHVLEEKFNAHIYNRSNAILIVGEEKNVKATGMVLQQMLKMTSDGEEIDDRTTAYLADMISDGKEEELDAFGEDCICVTMRGKTIKAKTVGQKKYVDAVEKNTVVFGIGPAGTGKTFLAVAMAVQALREKKVSRIVLTRPAIEAGERLGFLPGDLQSKIDPYLRPLYDALFEMMGAENYQKHLERGTIEIAPLAYMRGRTLDDSFIILDEAQNATPEQMKMFLTRLGSGSHAVITGDLTQTDLPHGTKSGLSLAVKILDGIDDIYIHRFTEKDVVRHKLVQKIILAYEKYEHEKATSHMTGEKYRFHKKEG